MRAPQFNLRLPDDTRAKLEKQANGVPLGKYLIDCGLSSSPDALNELRQEVAIRDRIISRLRKQLRAVMFALRASATRIESDLGETPRDDPQQY